MLKTYESKRFFSDKVCNECTNKEPIANCPKCTKNEATISQVKRFNALRIIALLISVFLLPSTVFLAFTSYDLHALSCIVEPSEEFINYDPSTNTVELRYSDNILWFRRIIVGFIILFSLVLLINAGCFYLCNSIIINNLKPRVNIYLNEMVNRISTDQNQMVNQMSNQNQTPSYKETAV